MRVYGWEPVRCYDSFSLAWGKVADIAVSSSQLVSYRYMYCTFNTLVLYVHVLYLFVIEGFKTPRKQISRCLHLLTFFCVMVLQIGASFNQTNVSLWVVDLGVCIIH